MNIIPLKPLQVYLDTSVISFAVSTQDVKREKERTIFFLNQIKEGKFKGYISEVVVGEIEEATGAKQKELLKVIVDIPLKRLVGTSEASHLARKYIDEGIIPEKYLDDALHLAIASVNKLDAVVSWNFAHLVKFKTRREVKGINILLGYQEIDIATPEEMIENERT